MVKASAGKSRPVQLYPGCQRIFFSLGGDRIELASEKTSGIQGSAAALLLQMSESNV